MSRGQLARTRENFPQMNDRAGRRRARRQARSEVADLLAGAQKVQRGWAVLGAAVVEFVEAVADGVRAVAGSLAVRRRPDGYQADYALVAEAGGGDDG